MIQLIYTSKATRPFATSDLAELLAKSRRNNMARGLSGMLLYHQGSFIQLLEGEPLDVLATYRKIEADPRHHSVQLLMQLSIKDRTFPDWTMGFAQPDRLSDFDPTGLNHFFAESFSPQMFAASGTLAKKILLEFRDGQLSHSR
jgi:hypothetical protein